MHKGFVASLPHGIPFIAGFWWVEGQLPASNKQIGSATLVLPNAGGPADLGWLPCMQSSGLDWGSSCALRIALITMHFFSEWGLPHILHHAKCHGGGCSDRSDELERDRNSGSWLNGQIWGLQMNGVVVCWLRVLHP